MRKIQFFSPINGTFSYKISEIENRFKELDKKPNLDINDFLELYSAKLYLENELYLTECNEEKKNELKHKAASIWQKIKEFFLQLDTKSLNALFDRIDSMYVKHFWKIIDQLKIYENINNESIKSILVSHPKEIRNILKQQRLVKVYSNCIRDFLISNPNTAELLLAEEDNSKTKNKFYFPVSLTNIDKEKIINDYLNLDSPNLNYVNLVLYAKENPSLMISDKTKLRAKQTYNRITEEFLNSDQSSTQTYAIEVGTVDTQDELVIKKRISNTYKITYQVEAFIEILRKEDLTLLFHNLFEYTDRQGLITLVNKESETSSIEKIFMRSKNEYSTGITFSRKCSISIAQIALAISLLKNQSKSISTLIDNQMIKLSSYDKELSNLHFTMPNGDLSHEDSIKILAPSLDSLLKQYSFYINDSEIDFDLLEISSKPVTFGNIKSKIRTKYIYPNRDSKIEGLFNIFFSDQSILHYIAPYDDKYDCFYDLLVNEKNLRYSNFQGYQKDTLDFLISENLLLLENREYLKIKNEYRLIIIGNLYRNGVVSYWHFPPTFRKEMDDLLIQGFCYSESKLFTKDEVTYLNYYLNKKEYTDGPDLRNKYLHGTNINSKSNKEMDYFMYLRIVIICLLKIEDDLLITTDIQKYQ